MDELQEENLLKTDASFENQRFGQWKCWYCFVKASQEFIRNEMQHRRGTLVKAMTKLLRMDSALVLQ